MQQIKCPKCGEVFTIDESSYEVIVGQIKNAEFKKELEEELHKELERISSTNDAKMEVLKNQVESASKDKEAALNELKLKLNDELTKKEMTIQNLMAEKAKSDDLQKAQIELAKNEAEKASSEAITALKDKINDLVNEMTVLKSNNELQLSAQKDNYELQLKQKQTEVDYYKDLKTKLSTKLVGETLEQHCLNEFNRIRMTAFPNAYFEKDNDAKSGSKGDFIYKETDDSGAEILSIMFEMKNENDTTATKHKNEDFLKELDKDRNEKKCEYAVLVSMLEADSDLYNSGIVDVSYIHPKMYVVRPQCFLSIIGILRNASLNALSYKRELMVTRNQNIDITNFEDKLLDFQDKFGKNVQAAKKKFGDAIEEINKTIDHLEKVRDNLLASTKQLGYADDKAQELTIKKLTHGNKTMKEKFDELKKDE